ncbi:MAG: ferrous iron transport protein B [Anaerolineae bacterium]|nr:ferrous iron transport protein B [Anaerolineae bacterium]
MVIQAAILGAVFWLTFTLGTPLQEWLEGIVGAFGEWIGGQLAWAPQWLSGLIVDGVIGGAGLVLTFLPILIIFFAVLGILEDVGYMARAAYVMDGLMHLMGLHGKSFLPLFLGFGCNVPSVFGTRVIESPSARLLTILLVPLIPCTARMAVIAFLAPAFFGSAATLVSWGMILVAMFTLAVVGIVLNKTVFRGQHVAFIMELPLYHIPNWRTIGMLVWQRSLAFVRRAGTLIVIVSILVWVLSTLPHGDIETSFLATLGKWLEPLGQWMGFDWRLTVALLTSFIAKENSIATLGILFGADAESGLAESLAGTLSVATALAFMTVQVLFIPCVATFAAMRQETGSWRWTLFNTALLGFIAIAGGIGVYWLASLLGW